MASSLTIKWCQKNLNQYSQAVYDVLTTEHPDLQMEVSDCLEVCSLCIDVPFAFRNGALISARDARGLYKKLKQGMSFLTEAPLPGTYAAVAAVNGTDNK